MKHEWQRVRDVPRTCHCTWLWVPDKAAFARAWAVPGCPWHTERSGYESVSPRAGSKGTVSMYETEDPPILGPANVQVPRPAYDRLAVHQARLRQERGRLVSKGETVEWLLDRQDEREKAAR